MEQSKEYQEYIKWAKVNDPTFEPLTGNNVKFVEYLLANQLGTSKKIFESVKKFLISQ